MKTNLTIALLFLAGLYYGQAPQKMSYHVLVKNKNNETVNSQNISLKTSAGSSSGSNAKIFILGILRAARENWPRLAPISITVFISLLKIELCSTPARTLFLISTLNNLGFFKIRRIFLNLNKNNFKFKFTSLFYN